MAVVAILVVGLRVAGTSAAGFSVTAGVWTVGSFAVDVVGAADVELWLGLVGAGRWAMGCVGGRAGEVVGDVVLGGGVVVVDVLGGGTVVDVVGGVVVVDVVGGVVVVDVVGGGTVVGVVGDACEVVVDVLGGTTVVDVVGSGTFAELVEVVVEELVVAGGRVAAERIVVEDPAPPGAVVEANAGAAVARQVAGNMVRASTAGQLRAAHSREGAVSFEDSFNIRVPPRRAKMLQAECITGPVKW